MDHSTEPPENEIDNGSDTDRPRKRQRASRAGQAKRFECKHPTCGKKYSRAEHLHRHELNHNPKEIYRCQVANCGHSFVRQDLFARHQARHADPNASATPASVTDAHGSGQQSSNQLVSPVTPAGMSSTTSTWNLDTQPSKATPSSSIVPAGNSVAAQAVTVQESALLAGDLDWLNAEQPSVQANDNFAAWLFQSPGSQNDELNLTNMPFLDFELEYSPKDIWNFDDLLSDPNATGQAITENHLSRDHSPKAYGSQKSVSPGKASEIFYLLSHWLQKDRRNIEDPAGLLFCLDGHFPNLTLEILDNLIANYWLSGNQIPIIHEPTFASDTCNVLLLMAILAMGANDLIRSQPKGQLRDYRELADLIMTHLRWDIFTDIDAQPPIQLWVAQALLLVEYYEKQCSTRKLHERGHIHHATTLTLLRRGSPLVGRSESETPPADSMTRGVSPVNGAGTFRRPESAMDAWWLQWVRGESFNRVVFCAFQMDILHASMWGHAADMAPYEIRLQLPCDDSLWNATSAEEVQRLDANLKMYGIRPLNFLDGLKRCLHGREVNTHAPGRIHLMAGLLSVGWHISRREKHLQFLETVPSVREQGRWRLLLLQAFGHWRRSFDEAIGAQKSGGVASREQEINSARSALLFHLAHITMNADIIDCQIFAGAKRLLGRKVTKKDYVNVVQRMRSWASNPVSRHAVLHAFKLLHETLINESLARRPAKSHNKTSPTSITYNCRTDPTIYRPWGLFIAGLIIWAYQHATSLHITSNPTQPELTPEDEQAVCCRYLTICAAFDDFNRLLSALSPQGCAAILGVLSRNFANGEPEILLEASQRLWECRDTIQSSNFNPTAG